MAFLPMLKLEDFIGNGQTQQWWGGGHGAALREQGQVLDSKMKSDDLGIINKDGQQCNNFRSICRKPDTRPKANKSTAYYNYFLFRFI